MTTRSSLPSIGLSCDDDSWCSENEVCSEPEPVDIEAAPEEQCGSATSLEGQGTSVRSSIKQQITKVSSLADQNMLRVTNIRNVLRRGGCVLRGSSGSDGTYLLSKSRAFIDIFISHNWAVPRWKKFWALALYFNVVHAVVISYFCVAIGCVLNLLSVPPDFRTAQGTMRPHCMILGSCGFLLTLMFGHDLPFGERLWCRQQVFLDKICIHQSDPALKEAGINSLGAFLKYSRKMLVLFNHVYCKKLWTVYEAACYMYLHRWSKLELLPVDIASVVLKSTVLVTVENFFSMVTVSAAHSQTVDPAVPQIASTLLGAILISLLAFILRGWALQFKQLYSDLRSFQFGRAHCMDERDRVVISSNICAFVRDMGLVDVDAFDVHALQSFEQLVQKQMPELLRSAIGHAGFPYKYALVAGIGQDFYTFDEISSMQDPSALQVLARLVNGFVIRAAVLPCIFLVCALLSNTCTARKGLAELAVKCAISAITFFVTSVLLYLSRICRDHSEQSVWWLTGFAVCGAALTLVIVRLFAWRPGTLVASTEFARQSSCGSPPVSELARTRQ